MEAHPFSGEWGISTSFFASSALAALEARTGKKVIVPQRARKWHTDQGGLSMSRHQPDRGGQGLSQLILETAEMPAGW